MSHHTTSGPRPRGQTRDRARIKIKGGWTAIPNRLLKDKRLSRDARLLGCLFFMHAANHGRAFPSQEELADELGQIVDQDDGATAARNVTVRSVQRWLAELRQTGWLEWRQTQRNNEYTLLDPTESSDDSTDSSLNNGLTEASSGDSKATQESRLNPVERSPQAAEGSARVTDGKSRATQESWSTTTQRSPRATQESSRATQESWSSSIKDSLILDSSSSESVPDRQSDDDDDPVVRFLESIGVTAAYEFAGLDLLAVQERVAYLQRDPNCRPGAIVNSLRAAPPQRIRASGEPIDVDKYTSGEYGALFKRGGDTSDLVDAREP